MCMRGGPIRFIADLKRACSLAVLWLCRSLSCMWPDSSFDVARMQSSRVLLQLMLYCLHGAEQALGIPIQL